MSLPHGPIAIAIIGPGKIARDQHLPSIAGNRAFHLAASVGGSAGLPGVAAFPDLESLRQNGPTVDAVAICTPPQVRTAIALQAIEAGWHVFLEKPPAATLGECAQIRAAAEARGVTLLASWHSRFAPMVESARDWLAGRRIKHGTINWRENVRQWHPGQKWLWQPAGLGVFDPGINALSIFTAIYRAPVMVKGAEFDVPLNCQTPIKARLELAAGDAPIAVDFNFLQLGHQSWDIELTTTDGSILALHEGGARMTIDGVAVKAEGIGEYPGLYHHFATLIREGRSDADFTPLRLVADAFMIARHHRVEAFED